MEFFRDKTRDIRKKQKITMARIAELLGVSERTYAAWERDENNPRETDVRVIAQVLDVGVHEISSLEEFKFSSKEAYYLEGLNPITQIQQHISSTLSIEEKRWILRLLNQVDILNGKANYYEASSSRTIAIVDSLQSFVYSKNEKLEFTYINPAYLSFLHIPFEEIKGKKSSYLMGDKDVRFVVELEKATLKGTNIKNREITIPGSNGRNIGLFSATPMTNSKGQITGLFAAIEDITERMATDEHLKQIEKVINKSNDLLWIKTKKPVLRTFFVSSAISRITGVSPGEMQKSEKLWLKLVHEEDKKRVKEFYERRSEGNLEYRIVTNNGKTKWLSEEYYPSIDENIEFSIIRDITKEKALTINNEIFALASDEASEGFWLFDEHDEKHLIFNRAETEITGLTEEDYRKYRYSFNRTICKKDKFRIFKKYLKNRKIRKNFIATYEVENVKTKQKRKVRVSTHFLTIKGRNYTFGITRDITEKDR